jgi:hypothetical protein
MQVVVASRETDLHRRPSPSLMLDIIVLLPLFSVQCPRPCERRDRQRRKRFRGSLRDRMLSQLGPDSLQADESGRNSSFRCVSGAWPVSLCLRCPETMIFAHVFAREAGGGSGREIQCWQSTWYIIITNLCSLSIHLLICEA